MKAYILLSLLVLSILAVGCLGSAPKESSDKTVPETHEQPQMAEKVLPLEDNKKESNNPIDEITDTLLGNTLDVVEINGENTNIKLEVKKDGDTLEISNPLFSDVKFTKVHVQGCGERNFEADGSTVKIDLKDCNSVSKYYDVTLSVILSQRTPELNEMFPFCTAQTSMPGLAICSMNLKIEQE